MDGCVLKVNYFSIKNIKWVQENSYRIKFWEWVHDGLDATAFLSNCFNHFITLFRCFMLSHRFRMNFHVNKFEKENFKDKLVFN